MPDSVSAVGSGGRYVYDENGAGSCEPAEAEDAARDLDCAIKAGKAATVCAGAAVAVATNAPTLIGGVVAAFIGGLACGLEVADAYICYSDD